MSCFHSKWAHTSGKVKYTPWDPLRFPKIAKTNQWSKQVMGGLCLKAPGFPFSKGVDFQVAVLGPTKMGPDLKDDWSVIPALGTQNLPVPLTETFLNPQMVVHVGTNHLAKKSCILSQFSWCLKRNKGAEGIYNPLQYRKLRNPQVSISTFYQYKKIKMWKDGRNKTRGPEILMDIFAGTCCMSTCQG